MKILYKVKKIIAGCAKRIKIIWIKFISKFYKKDKNLWVFGEWFGKRCCDNCLYLANYVAEKYPSINLVWIAKEEADLSLLNKNIKVVLMDSSEAKKVLKRASVAVMNQNINDFSENNISYFGKTITINLWHGIPWKKIFYDYIKFDNWFKKLGSKLQNDLLKAKYFLALSDDFKDILERSVPLKEKNIILSGYPRNSIFYDKEIVSSMKDKVIKIINQDFNKNFTDIKVITYMPTFRDKTSETFSFNSVENNDKLNEILKEHNAIIVQKAHFVNINSKDFDSGNGRIFNLNNISAQELLAASDILITDYSSCFFDYLILDRPIIHYLYDYDYYVNDDRGVYYKKEDVVSGDVAQNVDELINYIDINLKSSSNNKELRSLRRQKFLKYESSDSCQELCDFIFSKLKIK